MNHHMGMADERAVRRSLRWRRVIVRRGIDKATGLEVLDRHSNSKPGVGLDCLAVLGEDELGGRHLVYSQNTSHWHGVAGPTLDLLPVRKRNLLRQAKVDALGA